MKDKLPTLVTGARSNWLSRLLGIGAILEIPVGLGLLVDPSAIASLLLGAPLSDTGVVVARLAGGALIALGIACWSARSTPTARAGAGVAGGLLVYNVVACVTLALVPSGPGGRALLLSAVVIHGLMAAALLGALAMRGRQRDS